jgi:micrococcal nuclease
VAQTTNPAGGVAATAVSITDGDTLTVRFEDGAEDTVRLIGVNAPEGGECFADAATAQLTVLLTGREVVLLSDTSDRDEYGRLLRYVWADGTFVNEALVVTGHAIARRYPPDTAQAGLLERAQQEARDNAAGMWQPNACGPVSSERLEIVQLVADPPGDDVGDLNGEFVTITNLSATPASLDGWGLRDTSSSNRYFFPPGVILLLNESLSVHSGCGQDGPHDLYWCHSGSAIWNNDGDTAYLIDPSGNIHDLFVYPTEAPGDSSPHGFVGNTTLAGCDPSYPTVCIPSPPPDLDCSDIYYRRFSVVGSDPHHFDGDRDGVGCESN